MAVYLTNGNYYIAHNSTGAVIKVDDIGKAQDFYTVKRALNQRKKTPGKCAGYYYIDTEAKPEENNKVKRKSFSTEQRNRIYKKTKGHCYLCGEFVDFDSFEIEHNIPLAKGGTNDFENLFCSCHCCNTMKNSIYPHELMENVTQIFMYQMGKKYHNSIKWKMARRLLENLI